VGFVSWEGVLSFAPVFLLEVGDDMLSCGGSGFGSESLDGLSNAFQVVAESSVVHSVLCTSGGFVEPLVYFPEGASEEPEGFLAVGLEGGHGGHLTLVGLYPTIL
jgi:hypothetical protein